MVHWCLSWRFCLPPCLSICVSVWSARRRCGGAEQTGTRSLEVFLARYLPGWSLGPEGGSIYAHSSATSATTSGWPRSVAALQPSIEAATPISNSGDSATARTHQARANPDLFLFHANYDELMHDWTNHRERFAPVGHGTGARQAPVTSVSSEAGGSSSKNIGDGVGGDRGSTRAPMSLLTTTILRDPLERLVSEFHFGIDFKLRSKWSTPEAWRRQFWGQKASVASFSATVSSSHAHLHIPTKDDHVN
jgi:hypothetical protein